MLPLLERTEMVSPLAAGSLVASVWQGVLLTAGVALCLRRLRMVTPAARSWVWTAVLLLVGLLPVLERLVPHAAAVGHPVVHVEPIWSVALLAVWVACSAARAAQLVWQGVRLVKVARGARPVPVDATLAALLAGPRRAELCVSADVDRPSVAGFPRPRVLLPTGLLEALSRAELEQVVLHEMEHLRRWDDWLNGLQQLMLVLLPLHPAVLWLHRRLCRERELACDDGVLRATAARKAYAACLVRLAEDAMRRRGVALALSVLGSRTRESELVGRVRRILAGAEEGVPGARWGVRAGMVAAGAIVGAGLLAGSPQLVCFDAAPASMAQAAAPALAGDGAFLARETATPLSSPKAPHMMLTEAVMAPRVPAAGRVGVPPRLRRRAVLRSTRTPLKRLAAPAWTPLAAAPRPVSSRRVLTEVFASQPMYAAVPWRDGWLILQL